MLETTFIPKAASPAPFKGKKMETTPKAPEAPKPKGNTWKLIAIVVVILIVVGVAAYILTQTATASANVIIQDDSLCSPNDASCLFNPAAFNATVNGSAVVWRNDGHTTHTVATNATLNGSLPTFSSPSIVNGGTYSFSFTTAGTYNYYCTIHPWMKGTVIAK
jgi:plastocyanin